MANFNFVQLLKTALLWFACLSTHVNAALDSGVFDLVKQRYHGVTFLEIGYFYLDSLSWVYTTATFTNFTDPLVFLSLPEVPGELHTDGYPAIPRLRAINREVIGKDFSITTFESKIFLANDSYCSKEWYTPVAIAPLPIVWMVIERGAWDLDGDQFFANSGLIYRLDNTYEEYNYPKLFNVPDMNGDITGFPSSTDVGAVTQLQSLLYDRFMLIRGRTIFRNAVKLLLVPHDSTDPTYYRLVNPNETVAFILFKSGYAITCKEKLTLESRRYVLEVNEIKRNINFQNTFLRPPGVFGMIQSMLGQDSVGLRVFERTNSTCSFITQEDQCFDEDTSHTTLETVAVVIVGQIAFESELVCNVVFDNPRPTSFPTFQPSAKPSAKPTLRPTTATPSALPTAKPTAKPSAQPTAQPSAKPTAVPTTVAPSFKPSAKPTAVPTTVAPSFKPTAQPTARPTTAEPSGAPTLPPVNHTDVVMLMRGNFGLLWEGPKFFAASTSNASLFVGIPDVVENPKVRAFQPQEGGLYVFTAGFESTPVGEIDVADLLCKVYWSVSVLNITSNTTVTFEGTYNSTLALNYDYTTAVWSVQFTENMLENGYVACVPSAAPTFKPTLAPTAKPTEKPTAFPTAKPSFTPTANPTAKPTAKPTAHPTRVPTPSPTNSPTLEPTKQNNTDVDLRLVASNGDTWGGVQLFIQSGDETTYYQRAPNATVGNPLSDKFLPMISGLYVVSAVLPPSVSQSAYSDGDLRCMIYWEFNISRSGEIYYGTYNTTLVFQYEYFKDTWVLLYSENLIDRYKPCFPSSAPTRRPSRQPTLSPTRNPTFAPSNRPTRRPTRFPTAVPTPVPSAKPTLAPTRFPTRHPTFHPTEHPTFAPTSRPTFAPTRWPTRQPTRHPTRHPTAVPTESPTAAPSESPTSAPTFNSSRVIITMVASYAEDWSGAEMLVTGPENTFLFRHPGPQHGIGEAQADFFPEGSGNYTFEAKYATWIPDFTDAQTMRCQIYFMLNFTNEASGFVIHGTYETKVVLVYDWYSDDWDIIAEQGSLDGYDPCSPTPTPTVAPTMFNGNGGTYDMILDRYVVQPWMEIGYTALGSRSWTAVTGSFTNFYDPVVFLSLPNIDGETSNDGFAVSARLNNVMVTRTSSTYSEVTFDAKLYLTNDSFCSRQWYTPEHVDPPIPISWMIAERGAWNLSSRFFFVDKGPITRVDDSYFLYNMIRRENPYECDAYDAPCKFPDFITVDNIGAITQIQTLVYDRFLLVRAYALNRKQGLYLLTPHDSSRAAYYAMPDPETMAFMHFQGGVSITCRESITIETSLHRVTHFKEVVRYRHNFTVPPGVFGMVSSVIGQDSVGLRAFDRTNNGAAFITQEDKCFDLETNHTSEELVSIFVAGAVMESSDFKCDIIHDYTRPSTFRDNGGTFDMIHKRYIDDIWLEIGFTTLDAARWVYIETTFRNFTDPVVFLSLPDIPGETSNDGFPAVGRLKNVELTRFSDDNSTTSFEAKLFLANDSACSSQWYTPKAIWPPIPISWMVAERGAWNLSSNFFFVDRSNIWRDDETYENYNYVTANHPTGCVSRYIPCQFPDYITVDRLGAVTQLQTLVYDRFLLVRGFSITRKFGRYLLTPHDSAEVAYYELWTSEVMGFMHYHDNVRLNCKEDLTIETQIFKEAVTNVKVFLPYRTLFNRPPGVFGQIMTTIGRDSVGLRAFNRSVSGSHFITQEDQCFDEETDHTTPETVSLFIAGSLFDEASNDSNFTCNMRFTESKFIENGGTFDLIEDEYAVQPWMEFGYTLLDDVNFVTISASFKNFIDPVVFLSLPDIPGDTSNLGYPAVGRVKNVVLNRNSSTYSEVSFDAKLFLANDSACSKEFYTPYHINPPLPISWIVAEIGAWNLSDNFFYVNRGEITRDDHTYESYNMKRLFNRPGCNSINEGEPCAFPRYISTERIGMIAQLQTIVYDRFLLVRGFEVTRKAGLYLLTPHDSSDLGYYAMPLEETIGYIHFSSGASLTCRESITIETSLHHVTNEKQVINFVHNFTVPPGVFGLVSTVIGQDSVGLRAFDRTLNSAAFITQEDQCVDIETKHTSLELVSILVTGSVVETSKTKCDFVLWSPPTEAPTPHPSGAPTAAPSSATPSAVPTTHRPTLVSEFRTPYPSTLPEFVTNVPTNLNKLHTEVPTVSGQWETAHPTLVSQFHSNGPTTTAQFATEAPTIYTQFHTEAPTTVAQFETQPPTRLANFATEGPTTSAQFRTGQPTAASALYTHAPTVAAQFETPVPTRTTQFHTNSPNYRGTARPSAPSAFVTEAPTTLAQRHSSAPTLASQFVTQMPTQTRQFSTNRPSELSNFYSFIPTRSEQFQTSHPTLVSQFSSSAPTAGSQLSTPVPSQSSAFTTSRPTAPAQFSTEAPTTAAQFSTGAPSASDAFVTQHPTTVDQFHTAAPTTAAQFVTARPTLAEQFSTRAPSTAAQFRTSCPTAQVSQSVTGQPSTVAQHRTEAPTTAAQFVTNAPTLAEDFHTQAPSNGIQFNTRGPTQPSQFLTRSPTLGSQFMTRAPTQQGQFHTNAPTPTAAHSTPAPTAPSQFVTARPTLLSQFATGIPTRTAEFHTEHPSRIAQYSTRSPTGPDQFSTRAPTSAAQFSTLSPTLVSQFHTNAPTRPDQFYVNDFVSNAPTTAAQFGTQAPTASTMFHTRAPSTDLQWRTAQPSAVAEHVTNYPTNFAQFSTEAPTRVSQFHTSIPTRVVQYKSMPPTTADAFLTAHPTPTAQFATSIPTTEAEFNTNIPTKDYQYHTEHPTTVDQFPPHLRPQGAPTSRPTGATMTAIQFEAYSDIYNSPDCSYWLSTTGQAAFKRGVIATQPSTPQALMEEDITITDCVMVQVNRRSLRGNEEPARRSLQVVVPRVLWRIDTFVEYFGYTNGTKYFDDFVQSFFSGVSSGLFIGAMEAADPSLVGVSTGSSDTVFGPYATQSQAKSNGVFQESNKYFWPILVSSLFCCCCLLFLLCFLFVKRRKEKDGNVAPTEHHETIVVRETTIVAGGGERADLSFKQSARHQVKISAVSVSSPSHGNKGRGRVLTPGAAKSYKEFTGLAPYNASDPSHSEKLQRWIINLEQSNATYREKLDIQGRDDEPSLLALLTRPGLTDEQTDLLMDLAEELYADCESLFGRLNGVVETHGSMKFGRIRQTKYTPLDESYMPSPPRPNSNKSNFL